MLRYAKKIAIFLTCIILLTELIIIPNMVQASTYTQTTKVGIENFPASYQAGLNNLQALYPNWTFTAYYTGITWDEFINEEMSVHTRNTIKTSEPLWIDACNQSVAGGYMCASKAILQYYSDPRNFLNESGIFQFLEMTYNSSSQTEQGVQSILNSTFMKGSVTFELNGAPCTMTYAQIIMEAARQSRMSPYSIAIKIRQEVGVNGSNSVSGYYQGVDGILYQGYYNFFNYGAHDTGDPITNGLKYAQANGWTNQYIAIVEGAKLMANSYTNAGQNTAYFYKWDVVGTEKSELFGHQYMTNIQDPSSQSKSLFNTYAKNGLLTTPLNFIIPVFENMPNVNGLPTSIDTNLPTTYYIKGTGVRLREGPSTSTSILSTLDQYEIVTVLEWNSGSANNVQWSKIQRANGSIGYVANQYLVQYNNGAGGSQIAKTIGDILLAVPEKRVSEVATALSATSYSATRADNTPMAGDAVLATGDKYNLNGTVYTVAVLGDVFADGAIDARDYIKIKNHIMGVAGLNDLEMTVANAYVDNTIDARDYIKIKNYIMGAGSITI